jgi:hypothetical protein
MGFSNQPYTMSALEVPGSSPGEVTSLRTSWRSWLARQSNIMVFLVFLSFYNIRNAKKSR